MDRGDKIYLSLCVGFMVMWSGIIVWGITMKCTRRAVYLEAFKAGAGEYQSNPESGESEWVWKSTKKGGG